MADIEYMTNIVRDDLPKRDFANMLRYAAKTTWPWEGNKGGEINLDSAASKFRKMANLLEHGYELQLVKTVKHSDKVTK